MSETRPFGRATVLLARVGWNLPSLTLGLLTRPTTQEVQASD